MLSARDMVDRAIAATILSVLLGVIEQLPAADETAVGFTAV